MTAAASGPYLLPGSGRPQPRSRRRKREPEEPLSTRRPQGPCAFGAREPGPGGWRRTHLSTCAARAQSEAPRTGERFLLATNPGLNPVLGVGPRPSFPALAAARKTRRRRSAACCSASGRGAEGRRGEEQRRGAAG